MQDVEGEASGRQGVVDELVEDDIVPRVGGNGAVETVSVVVSMAVMSVLRG